MKKRRFQDVLWDITGCVLMCVSMIQEVLPEIQLRRRLHSTALRRMGFPGLGIMKK